MYRMFHKLISILKIHKNWRNWYILMGFATEIILMTWKFLLSKKWVQFFLVRGFFMQAYNRIRWKTTLVCMQANIYLHITSVGNFFVRHNRAQTVFKHIITPLSTACYISGWMQQISWCTESKLYWRSVMVCNNIKMTHKQNFSWKLFNSFQFFFFFRGL